MDKLILKGNIAFSVSPDNIMTCSDSYIIVENGLVQGIYQQMPENYAGIQVADYGNDLIIPAFIDLHIHAPQFYQRGVGMDMELLDWLKKYTFPQEEQFSNLDYARRVYRDFADELIRQGTFHASIYATIHKEATEILFEILSKKGIRAYVGKVNIDRNSSRNLIEKTDLSLRETEELIIKYMDNPIKPIITPRFVPTCSTALLKGLGELAVKYNLPVQSHLAENRNEVEWVQELHPEVETYSEVYHYNQLFGQTPTLMAHCIYLEDKEIELIRNSNVIPVHCPESNLNLASGIMPVRRLLDKGIKVGLGTDVGGGHNISMTKAIVRAIQLSKIAKVHDPSILPLTLKEVFYMATKGGGSFFGKVGSFEKDYSFDGIVIDDASLGTPSLDILERLQRFIYIGDDRNIRARYMNGRLVN